MDSAARSARLPTISEWWYVPGVSTRSRRRSGWDGFASSSSWNTVRIPNTDPMTAKLPTAATAAPPADTAAAPTSSSTPRTSWSPSSANVSDDQRLDDEHGDARLDEHGQPVAAADADDARDAAEHHVGRELQARAVDRRGEDRDQRRHDHGDAGVEQHRDQHPDRRQRQRVRQPGPLGRQLEREHREQQQQAEQEQDVVAMPELAAEPPGPGQQQADDQDREHDEADQPRDVQAALVEAEVLDRLEGDLVHAVAAPDDRLAPLPGLHHVGDGLGGAAARLLRELRGERGVGHDERPDQRGGERGLGPGQVAREPALDPIADRRQLGVPELGALDGVEDPRGLGADGLPALGVEREQGRPVVRGELAGQRVREDRRAVLRRHAVGERRVDRRDDALELAQLLGRDRRAPGDREVVLELDRLARRLARALGEDVARRTVGSRRLDAGGRGLAHLEQRLGRQEVEAQDHRHRRDEQDRGRDQAARVAAGEAVGGSAGLASMVMPLRRRRSVLRVVCGQVRARRAPGRRARTRPCRRRGRGSPGTASP